MGRIILLTGGAKSGKSAEAERQVKTASLSKVAYIATQANEISDAETEHNIVRHREQRPSDWHTIESYQELDQVILKAGAEHGFEGYLIDCLTLWTSNLFFDEFPKYIKRKFQLDELPPNSYEQYIENLTPVDIAYFEKYFKQVTTDLISQMRETDAIFWLVTNEIGLGVVPSTKMGRLYREWLGKVNQWVAAEADQVFLSISGIPIKIKDDKHEN